MRVGSSPTSTTICFSEKTTYSDEIANGLIRKPPSWNEDACSKKQILKLNGQLKGSGSNPDAMLSTASYVVMVALKI